ncbi:hypothetical protein CVT26_014323 [Gymnopilus dilepis]|uniref:Nephrocystin 3-like N-terminal domain-containing protein n=1 Tax=Gymnopilus dilepis TaxID=231916 RepID=A0A409WTN0_9AGAR|nr:hypothetical protein CVT26_014323 [Gymnopilus dilepis]
MMVEMFNNANNVLIEGSSINIQVNDSPAKESNLAKLRQMAEWLTPLNFRAIQSDTYSKHAPGTGGWFLERQDFSNWISGERTSLSISGIPGAGKTILSSIIISHLEVYMEKNAETALAYAYFRHNESYSPSDILAAMIKQLIEGHHSAYAYLEGIYDDHKKKAVRPSVDDLVRISRGLIERLGKVYIVVDALDEASEDCRSKILRILSSLSISLLITTRPLDLSRLLPGSTTEVRIDDQTLHDIEAFATKHLEENDRIQSIIQGDEDLHTKVLCKVKEKSQGMFLAVFLHVDALSRCTNKKQLLKAAECLPSTLHAIYEATLQRIEAQEAELVSIAKRTIVWVTYAFRSLKIEELERVVAILPDEPGYCEDNITPLNLLVAWCCGLLVVDKKSNMVRLAHYTTYDFVKSLGRMTFPNPHTLLTSCCITYLRAFNFQDYANCLRHRWCGDVVFNQDGLFVYAYSFWPHHAKISRGQEAAELLIGVVDFVSSIPGYPMFISSIKYRSSRHVAAYYRFHSRIRDGQYPMFIASVKYWPPCHVAAYYGLLDVLRKIPDFQCQRTTDGQTSLMLAVVQGHFDVVEFLLSDNDVDINAIDKGGFTALHLAATVGDEAMVKLLLAHHAIDVNPKIHGFTPLHLAVIDDNELLHKLHLSHELLEPDNEHIYARTPSCEKNRKHVMRLLTAHPKIDVHARNDHTGTVFQTACIHAPVDIVQFLIEQGIDTILHDDLEWQLAVVAAITGLNVPVLEFLLSQRRDAEHQLKRQQNQELNRAGFYPPKLSDVRKDYDNGLTFLHIAVKPSCKGGAQLLKSRKCCIQLLLSHQETDINAKNYRGNTALHVICDCADVGGYKQEVVEAILSHPEVDVNARNNDSDTALDLLCKRGSLGPAKLLLSHPGIGIAIHAFPIIFSEPWVAQFEEYARSLICHPCVDVNEKGGNGNTVLHLICDWGASPCQSTPFLERIFELLISAGIDPNIQGYHGWTALQKAFSHNSINIVPLLLKIPGLEVDPKDPLLRNIVRRAGQLQRAKAENPQWYMGIIRGLLSKGLDVNAQDNDGQTALHYACALGLQDIVELFLSDLSGRIAVNVRDHKGKTALHLAQKNGHREIVFLLREHEDRRAPTILTIMASAGRRCWSDHNKKSGYRVFEMGAITDLLSKGADINAQDEHGMTALHWACSLGFHSIVELLLSYPDIDVNRKTILYEALPLHLASPKNYPAILSLFQKAGKVSINFKRTAGRQADDASKRRKLQPCCEMVRREDRDEYDGSAHT